MSEYTAFLDAKRPGAIESGLVPGVDNGALFPFQQAIVRWAIRRGRAAIFADTGLGKTRMRTKSKTLLFVQKNRDSSWSIPAMADYILLFRAPGENAEPILTDVTNEEWILWARPIWYGIRESATLQASAARAEKDEKHIAPLQLETVERCIRLWSNRGDLVLDPMAGIGTTGYVALRRDRSFVGIELKPEYWQQASLNLANARTQMSLGLEVVA